jgi:endonuclease/exonuclease/phosphatase (EEP) superfamily protein YafD
MRSPPLLHAFRRLLGLGFAVTALGGGAASAAAAAGALHPWLDLLAQFAPWLGLAALVGLLGVRLTLQRSRVRLGLSWIAAAGAAGAAVICAPELLGGLATPRGAHRASDLRLVQYNAFFANRDVEGSVRAVLAARPDIVLLQEVGGRTSGDRVERALRRTYRHGTPRSVWAKATILSRRPGRHRLLRWRGQQVTAFDTTAPDGRPVTVLALHNQWPEPLGAQAPQRSALAALVSRERGRVVLGGDFNMTPWGAAMRRQDRDLARSGLTRRTRALFSWPAQPVTRFRIPPPSPILPIDHVYAARSLRTVEVRRMPRTGSDHYPVLVVLRSEVSRPSP